MRTELIRPVEGTTVLHPDGRELAAAGEAVAWTTYWARRATAGEIEIVAAAAQPIPLKRRASAAE